MANALQSSCEEQQSNNLDEYSDDSDAESTKVRKAKKPKNPGNEKCSGSLICNLIDEYEARPCLWNIFCDDYHNRDVTGNNTALKFNGREGILYRKRSSEATLAHCRRFRQTIMNYHEPFDRKHDSHI